MSFFIPGRITVVEDDRALLQAIAFALQADGHIVQAFESGEALLDGEGDEADCFIIDYRLPRLDGLAVVDQLRARGRLTPIVLVTTSPDRAVLDRARDAGAVVLQKPLVDDQLREAVHQLLLTRY